MATKNENLGASWPQDFFLKVEHCSIGSSWQLFFDDLLTSFLISSTEYVLKWSSFLSPVNTLSSATAPGWRVHASSSARIFAILRSKNRPISLAKIELSVYSGKQNSFLGSNNDRVASALDYHHSLAIFTLNCILEI